MIRLAHIGSLAAALLAMSGCRSKSLQMLDGSGGGFIPIDASGDGGVTDGSGTVDRNGAIDLAWEVPFTGRRSYVVTSTVHVDGDDTIAISHAFTLTIDTDRHIAITGTPGSGNVSTVEQPTTGVLRVVGPLTFWVSVPAVCGGSVTYTDLTFMIGTSGLSSSGRGRGQLTTSDGTAANTVVGMTADLAVAPDLEPPALSLSASGAEVNPWAPFWLVSSEPLPVPGTWPTLRSTAGDVIEFGAATGIEGFVTVLARPWRLLRYGDTYRLSFDGVTDFAGNAPDAADLSFTTRAAPPLAEPDGFESVADATLGGARVLSGAGAPTIRGTRSLYVPPATSLWGETQFALRLRIAPGDTAVRFSYRSVNAGDGSRSDGSGIDYLVASVGGSVGTGALPAEDGATTTPAMIDGVPVLLGPTMTGAIALPADARGEVVFTRVASQVGGSCAGPPPPPVPGIIVDDLRVD